jgi:DNA-binding CsgD family transcriptional regulator
LFGVPADQVLGSACGPILQGSDECGPVCGPHCTIKQAIRRDHQVRNFDLLVRTTEGERWCNISVLIARVSNSILPYSINIIRPIDTQKRLELLVRNFIVTETNLPVEQAKALVVSPRSPAQETNLTNRELEVLRCLAKGAATSEIAQQLHISRTTVNNHIQNILGKLNAHSRLEAVRRAELSGLI